MTNPYNPDDYIELHDKTAFIELCKTFLCKDQLHYPIFTENENRVLIRSYLTKFGNLRIYEDSTPKTTKNITITSVINIITKLKKYFGYINIQDVITSIC